MEFHWPFKHRWGSQTYRKPVLRRPPLWYHPVQVIELTSLRCVAYRPAPKFGHRTMPLL